MTLYFNQLKFFFFKFLLIIKRSKIIYILFNIWKDDLNKLYNCSSKSQLRKVSWNVSKIQNTCVNIIIVAYLRTNFTIHLLYILYMINYKSVASGFKRQQIMFLLLYILVLFYFFILGCVKLHSAEGCLVNKHTYPYHIYWFIDHFVSIN